MGTPTNCYFCIRQICHPQEEIRHARGGMGVQEGGQAHALVTIVNNSKIKSEIQAEWCHGDD
jgi:hypothetical protein